jgi:ferric iron reductase protein FhuF
MTASMPSPGRILHQLESILPADAADLFRPAATAESVPATRVEDPAWLAEQVRLRGIIWGIDNRKVLGTLWWYSASVWLVNPLLASLVATGTALSARLDDVVLHRLPCSRFSGSHSTATAGSAIDVLADQIAETFDTTITALKPFTGPHTRPLWAIGADALGTRLLWAGRATGRLDAATALLAPIAEAIGPRMPRPRFIELPVPKRQPGAAIEHHRAVDRISCCLLYKVPDRNRCSGCPGIRPGERQQSILAGAGLSTRHA